MKMCDNSHNERLATDIVVFLGGDPWNAEHMSLFDELAEMTTCDLETLRQMVARVVGKGK